MSKITMLESAGFLRIRVERLLLHYDFKNTDLIGALVNNNVKLTFKDSNLIIMDLDNYGIDVLKIIHEIKGDGMLQEIPIILLSSQADIKTLKKAIKVGCSEFVTKPFSDQLLMQKIHKVFNKEYKDLGIPKELIQNQQDEEIIFSWNKDYEIGIAEIDQEHKTIIDSYEKLYNYMKTGKGHEYYNELVEFLGQYVNDHFTHEELFQESIKYSDRANHSELHKEFKERIASYIEEHKNKDVTNIDLIKINLFLKDWLIHHILVEDAKIGEFLTSKN